MTRGSAIGWLATLVLHAAVLFGVPTRPSLPPPPVPEEPIMEVALYEPPPPAPVIPEPPTDPTPLPPPEPLPPPDPVAPPPPERPTPAPVTKPPEPKPEPKPERRPKTQPSADPSPTPPRPTQSRPPEKPAASRAGPPGAGTAAPRPVTPAGYQNVGSVSYLSRGRATYPPDALRKKQTGTVQLMLYINETGSVDRVEIVGSSGFPALDAAAAAAEQKSRFRPAVKNGVPVKAKARVPYTFQLK